MSESSTQFFLNMLFCERALQSCLTSPGLRPPCVTFSLLSLQWLSRDVMLKIICCSWTQTCSITSTNLRIFCIVTAHPLCAQRPRGAAVSSATAGWTRAVWCAVAGPPPERTPSTSCLPWSACQGWILASTPSSPSLTVSACRSLRSHFLLNFWKGRQTGSGNGDSSCQEVLREYFLWFRQYFLCIVSLSVLYSQTFKNSLYSIFNKGCPGI